MCTFKGIKTVKLLTALFKVFSLREFCQDCSLGAGRPPLLSAGQSSEQHWAGLQVASVVSPLGPLPALPGVFLHLTPRLPSRIQLQ